jgi:hypothetical protein
MGCYPVIAHLPGYSFLQEKVIGRAITGEQNRLEKAVHAGIPEEQRIKLDDLLTAEESLYQLTLLKREPKDFSHQEVQKEVVKRTQLTDLYQLAKQFSLNLSLRHEVARLIVWHVVTRPVVPSAVSYEDVREGNDPCRAFGHGTHSHPTGT